ncbi:MAG: hypothetical protein KatS3mg100_092 [Candidatus Parcubacteria bacterium]|nr:MAG: hypothetical protein KatS3mg100_092 [Candidatus Parcubacteria bacterium]
MLPVLILLTFLLTKELAEASPPSIPTNRVLLREGQDRERKKETRAAEVFPLQSCAELEKNQFFREGVRLRMGLPFH